MCHDRFNNKYDLAAHIIPNLPEATERLWKPNIHFFFSVQLSIKNKNYIYHFKLIIHGILKVTLIFEVLSVSHKIRTKLHFGQNKFLVKRLHSAFIWYQNQVHTLFEICVSDLELILLLCDFVKVAFKISLSIPITTTHHTYTHTNEIYQDLCGKTFEH